MTWLTRSGRAAGRLADPSQSGVIATEKGAPMRMNRANRLFVAALAVTGLLAAAGSASATGKDVRVATYNAASGQYVVDASALKPAFADGTPVEEFGVRRFDGSDSLVLVRRGSSQPGQCRTQATPVFVRAGDVFVRVDSMPHLVLLCATPTDQFCDSCRFAQSLGGWKCVCYRDGAPTGFLCESGVQIVDNDPFIADWLLP